MTFSIIARCPASGQFGAAVSSSSPAVAARCIRVRAGVGAAVSQNITDPALGPLALDLMAAGRTPAQALAQLQERPFIDYRQLMAIDATHPPAVFTGASALGTLASAAGAHAACAGNMLASPEVPAAMLAAFERAEGVLAERLMLALLAGQAAGGEAGPVHSAGLLVCQDLDWPMVDLRLDWVEDGPVQALYAAWKLYEPQIPAYLTRARDPRDAPSFGVPGDL
ncbi:MAG: DUF1028 domain-containing protein [Achromobacter pulmonis]|uniref:DUF1028 domain-containing protein n=1 Tax=Achromobacter pulmonis TaxID=1389932 RepID=A0A6S7CSX3_9BURK|nr:DUF1028 domain-containing protein [Achromobacter pulmonis]MCF7768436.1 DUF1028 domain-containing protein [Achromobacter pulmonis]MPT25995.1 DUF1028 domain-containing protein [Achromobacter sp.]CAB3633466.1 hypothetical protein LMG26696_01249 [Achromobacter pulmonis]CAB3845063.1 hypothetical protein LMG26788_01460 [Achromobacter pulmonis]